MNKKIKKFIIIIGIVILIIFIQFTVMVIMISILFPEGITGEGSITYNGEKYEIVNSLWIDDDVIGQDIQVQADGYSKIYNALLYEEFGEKFIYVKDRDLLYGKQNTSLPLLQESNVEKIMINILGNDIKGVVIEQEQVKEFLDDINSYDVNEKYEKNFEVIGSIYVYFLNYPVHQCIGTIVKDKEGKWGFYKTGSGDGWLVDEYIIFTNQELLEKSISESL